MVGAIAVGCTAWARVSIVTSPLSREGVAPVRLHHPEPSIGAVTRAGDSYGSIVSRLGSSAETVVKHDRDIAVPRDASIGRAISSAD